MPLTPESILLVAGALFVSSLVYSLSGFGFGLLVAQPLLFAGIPLPETVTIGITCTFLQRFYLIYKHRSHLSYSDLWLPVTASFIGLPIGILGMVWLAKGSDDLIKQVVGGMIILALVLQWAVKTKPQPSVHWFWGGLAGGGSGLLTGFCNMGGPPIVLWVLAHNWDNERIRTALWFIAWPVVPVQLVVLWWLYGDPILHAGTIALAGLPIVLLGGWLGILLGKKFSTRTLRAIAMGLLVLVALAAILNPLFSGVFKD